MYHYPRGRLIFPFVCEIARIDTAAMEQDPDGSGDFTSGFDHFFRQPVKVPTSPTDQAGTLARKEMPIVSVPAQIEPTMFEQLTMRASGAEGESRFAIALHYRDLERLGLVDATTGRALFQPRDRLVRIRDKRGNLIEEIVDPPGLYAREVRSTGFGPGGRNLLVIEFESRSKSATVAP